MNIKLLYTTSYITISRKITIIPAFVRIFMVWLIYQNTVEDKAMRVFNIGSNSIMKQLLIESGFEICINSSDAMGFVCNKNKYNTLLNMINEAKNKPEFFVLNCKNHSISKTRQKTLKELGYDIYIHSINSIDDIPCYFCILGLYKGLDAYYNDNLSLFFCDTMDDVMGVPLTFYADFFMQLKAVLDETTYNNYYRAIDFHENPELT